MLINRRLFTALALTLVVSATPAALAQPARDVVVARLVSFPDSGHIGGCGRARWISLIEYDLVRVVSGTPPPTARFWVAVVCPYDHGVSLTPGSLHQMALAHGPQHDTMLPPPPRTGRPPFLWAHGLTTAP